MKKIFAIFISLLMFISINTYAVELSNDENTDTIIKTIDFSSMEKNILEKNMTVKINKNTINSLSINYFNLREAEDDLEDGIEEMENLLSIYQAQSVNFNPVLDPADPDKEDLKDVYLNVNKILTSLKGINDSNIATLQGNISSMEKQLESINRQQADMSRTIQKMQVQTEMVNKQMVWAGESLILVYDSINEQEKSIDNNLTMLEKQLKVLKIQEELGLISKMDIQNLQLKIEDLNYAKTTLHEQKENIKGQLNLLLGQPYDNPLEIEFAIKIDNKKLNSMDSEKDLLTAADSSYTLILQQHEVDSKITLLDRAKDDNGTHSNEYTLAENDLENEQLKLDDAKRQFDLSFKKLYQEVKGKEKALTLEKKKLEHEKDKQSIIDLRYELGLISGMEYDNSKAAYDNQLIKVETAESDLFKSYRKYEWMLKGISVQ